MSRIQCTRALCLLIVTSLDENENYEEIAKTTKNVLKWFSRIYLI